MTAINIIVSPTEVTIITDPLARTPLGPDFHVSKTIAIPHMRIAVATRGPIGALDKVTRAVSSQAFDYASARAFLADRYATMNLNDAEIFVGGWDGDKPSAFLISAANTDSKPFDIPYVVVTPTVSPEAFEEFSADPIAGLQALMQAQHEANSAVGGFINVTQVGPAVIETYTAGVIKTVPRHALATPA